MRKIDINDTVTIFGGNGFIGSYIVKELAPSGAKVKIVSRDPYQNTQLKVCGAVGQIAFKKGDVTSFKDIEENVRDSTYVINLVGALYEKGKQNFEKLHVEAAKNIALSCFNNDVRRLVHFSALGIERATTSKYAVTKLEGEKESLRIFPNYVSIRPSVVFGPEDNFINLFAKLIKVLPVIPLIGGGNTKFQPVYVADIAKAVKQCLVLEDSKVCGRVFELGGPKIYSLKEIYELILKLTHNKKMMLNIPFSLAKLQAFFTELLPHPILTGDQVELLKYDNVLSGKNGLEELGINLTNMEAILPSYIR